MVTRPLKEKMTPYEKWYDQKPNLAHLRVFGCMAYAYVPDSNRRGKLSKKAEKLQFYWVHQTKGYRLIDETHQESSYVEMPYSMNLTSIRMEMLVVVSIVLMHDVFSNEELISIT